MREHEKAEIDNMLKAGVIEPSSSEWASPIVFGPKKDGKLRFCVDYRKLNALTIRDSYHIPRMDECIDSLGDAGIFSTLDANSGYWQVEIHPEDKDKSAFSSHFGLFRFTRMPFGLRNAPATFQRVMDVILSSVRWQFALVYLDDVIIFSRSVEEHFAHVRTVLSLLQKAGVTLRIDKCCFFSATVDYLGHVIHPRRLAVSKRTCDAVSAFKPPKTATDIRSFVGLCNVFRRFIPNFAKIAAPLTAKLQKGQPTKFEELSDEEEKAFKSLKSKLVNPPILALPRSEGKFTLDTDACDTQVGCVLLQDQPDGHARPIGYWSRKLTKAEQAYTTTERECLAIVWAVTLLRPYLDRTRFTVRTDHSALRWILNLTDSTGRLTRWRLRLLEYDFDVVHRAGIKHQAPDALSRLDTDAFDAQPLQDDLPVFSIDVTQPLEDPDLYPTADPPRDQLDVIETTVLAITPVKDIDKRAISIEELLAAQKQDKSCQRYAHTVGCPGSQFTFDHAGILTRISKIDGALQKVLPTSLQPVSYTHLTLPTKA